eukprot:9265642-Pyramimonas_sp.AAC.1
MKTTLKPTPSPNLFALVPERLAAAFSKERAKARDPAAIYAAVKGEMRGEEREALQQRQNEAVIKFFHTPVR